MKRRLFVLRVLAALTISAARAQDSLDNLFDATSEIVGHNTNGMETPVNQLVTPTGILVPLPGMRPNDLALSPNGKLLVTSGLLPYLVALDPTTGKVTQRVPFPVEGHENSPAVSSLILNANEGSKLSFTGLAFSPDGSRIYLSNVNGDIKVFAVGPDERISPLCSLPLPPANKPGRKLDIPTGIAVSPDGTKIYVALNVGNQVVELSTDSGKLMRTWRVGDAPYDVVLCRKKLFVSNWGGRLPGPDSLTGPIGRNGTVRVDQRSVASEGSVSVIDLDDVPSTAGTEILTGRHACALALSPNRKFLAVANAGDDTVTIIDTKTKKVVETLSARQSPGDLFGAQPNALAFDKRGKRLFVCNGTQNAVAVFDFKPGKSRMLGLVPVGWFPCSIAFDARQKTLDVANIEDIAQKMEVSPKSKANGGMGFNSKEYFGSLSLAPVPS
ncbi:MAG TPA: beta-propeller fold lactonase family protein, partial [Verrucomicrobiae bacterium]|nr:beta-propeller fold lactonase family protein [Verrucomicrobiae bacterium]